MALQIISTDKVGGGVQVALGTDDDAFISAGATVGSTATYAISSSGNDQIVNVQGTVFGALSAIDLGAGAGTSHGQHLIIGEDGYVGTGSFSDAAVLMRGFDHRVDNAGTIHGESTLSKCEAARRAIRASSTIPG
jgi:hypothetical protein